MAQGVTKVGFQSPPNQLEGLYLTAAGEQETQKDQWLGFFLWPKIAQILDSNSTSADESRFKSWFKSSIYCCSKKQKIPHKNRSFAWNSTWWGSPWGPLVRYASGYNLIFNVKGQESATTGWRGSTWKVDLFYFWGPKTTSFTTRTPLPKLIFWYCTKFFWTLRWLMLKCRKMVSPLAFWVSRDVCSLPKSETDRSSCQLTSSRVSG